MTWMTVNLHLHYNISYYSTLAPQSAPLLTQNPINTGSAILTRMLSTQYTCRYSTPLFFMSSSTLLSTNAWYRPPFPSDRGGKGLETWLVSSNYPQHTSVAKDEAEEISWMFVFSDGADVYLPGAMANFPLSCMMIF